MTLGGVVPNPVLTPLERPVPEMHEVTLDKADAACNLGGEWIRQKKAAEHSSAMVKAFDAAGGPSGATLRATESSRQSASKHFPDALHRASRFS